MKLTKELTQKLMRIEEEGRGMCLANDRNFVQEKEGKEGLRRLEQRALSLIAMKDAFGWEYEDVREACRFHVIDMPLVGLYMKFFGSLERILKIAPKVWREYFTVDRPKFTHYDKERRYFVMRFGEFMVHPIVCGPCIEGFTDNFLKLIMKDKKIICREKECLFRGGRHHEYWVRW